ncbi:lipopolysaccharide biosynthesis protein [Oscillochloris sp. ZM17-4]|uniref:lipopolysaccharide biosynthesis protein n=1 Tax=Oscillochloris sp. ZM17-4 TaxID=2866714 RepID=UPI001C73DA5A|nr:oligosaccharide flippase family protein [Oscillochloris sp. ZM17-4]MBX0330977.1 lipopolysaccharide biosynthesis protein [Oscillochloris sp. ZM17-4]
MRTTANKTLARRSLRANFSWTFVGNVVYAGCQWGMLVVLAKLSSPEKLGQFVLGLAVTAPVIMFSNLHLRVIQATDAKHEYVFGDYFGLRLIMTALALLVIAGVVLVSGYSGETALVILAVGVAKAVESISDIFFGLLQQHESMDRVAKSLMLKGPLSLAALAAGVYLTGSVFWGSVALAAAWAGLMLAYDVRNSALAQPDGAAQGGGPLRALAHTLRPRWDRATLLRLAWMALPLGFAIMLVSLSTAIPRYFIERSLGVYSLGIFAAIAYIQNAGTTVVSALADSANPRLAQHIAAGDLDGFRALLLKLLGVSALLGLGGVLVALVAGTQILTLLYRPEYASRADLFVWVMAVAGIQYMTWFVGNGMTTVRQLRAQVPLFLVVIAATIGACLFFIPLAGMYGAVLAMLIAATTHTVGGLLVIMYALRRMRAAQAAE